MKKSRAAKIYGKGLTNAVLVIALILIVAGVVMFYASLDTRPFTMLAGIGIAGLMFVLWVKWDLSQLSAVYNPDSAEIALNDVLSADIVYLVNEKQSPRQVLASIYSNWQTGFVLMRYQIPANVLMQSLSGDSAQSQKLWNDSFALVAQVPVKE